MPEDNMEVETRKGLTPLDSAHSLTSLASAGSWGVAEGTTGGAGGAEGDSLNNAENGPLSELRSFFPTGREKWRHHSGELSEGPSESSAGSSHTLLSDDDFQSKIPHLERIYQQLAAKARLPERHGPGASNWVLSLARSYRRLSNDKRRRGRLQALLRQVSRDSDAELCRSSDNQSLPGSGLAGGSRSLPSRGFPASRLPGSAGELHGFQSNTDDSGYEAGYETDADESELSEWESGSKPQRHKRKLDALVQLTMRLSVSEQTAEEENAMAAEVDTKAPPLKTPRAVSSMSPSSFRFNVAPPPPFSTTSPAAPLQAETIPPSERPLDAPPLPASLGVASFPFAAANSCPAAGVSSVASEAMHMDVG
mmetsp:Transcript_73838/g.175780  ORF Transcript_73838/g.175780 Transcript_73838/m.175780 type:complete len:366 (+) Transcript_73838:185-1282(+)|eukprot:CAMPEP_0178381748 /NCGR_PEP_ID=MMETSP0689_2-20121128/6146_1 /TAXON_ID=160604 /ORGANISM="Amphidinium massartii, Strain CS-259" /LENGTH=365 /DNA_ID=CAMNT_0020001947 /DNA_START=93 /DNA_END=1190 /DNA_ORIENTATION=+